MSYVTNDVAGIVARRVGKKKTSSGTKSSTDHEPPDAGEDRPYSGRKAQRGLPGVVDVAKKACLCCRCGCVCIGKGEKEGRSDSKIQGQRHHAVRQRLGCCLSSSSESRFTSSVAFLLARRRRFPSSSSSLLQYTTRQLLYTHLTDHSNHTTFPLLLFHTEPTCFR